LRVGLHFEQFTQRYIKTPKKRQNVDKMS
jgi:hypothetical protein